MDVSKMTKEEYEEYLDETDLDGERHVLNGQITNGQYFKAVGDAKTNYPAKKCRIVKQNEGLVFLG